MLRFLDAGESHGKSLIAILDGFPSNVKIDINNINNQLARRQKGYGRGARMKIETDKVEILSGVRGGLTTGAPICVAINNKDFNNWENILDAKINYNSGKIIVPRPGHADLNGVLKYDLDDIRNVIERASARETSIRVAIGAICMELFLNFNVKLTSRVISIGEIYDNSDINMNNSEVFSRIEESPLRCFSQEIEKNMIKEIDIAKELGDTLGGAVEVSAYNIPCGLGSYSSYDKRMDYSLSGALMSIQGVKAIEFGNGINSSKAYGSKMNDEITIRNNNYYRSTNNAGGIEGGITNGMPITARVYMKPIPTTKIGNSTVDLNGNKTISRYERSDTCVVPALGVVCEGVMCFELTKAFLEKFSGDSIGDVKYSYDNYIKRIAGR
jgi:chorismate synthase